MNWSSGKVGLEHPSSRYPCWAWSLTADARLSDRALQALSNADSVFVSSISLFEIGQKVRIGKRPEMEPWVDGLSAILNEQGGQSAPLTPEICLRAAIADWSHRDPFDRLSAATALELKLPLLSADDVFDRFDGIHRIW